MQEPQSRKAISVFPHHPPISPAGMDLLKNIGPIANPWISIISYIFKENSYGGFLLISIISYIFILG
jgi:hypothetical protein